MATKKKMRSSPDLIILDWTPKANEKIGLRAALDGMGKNLAILRTAYRECMAENAYLRAKLALETPDTI